MANIDWAKVASETEVVVRAKTEMVKTIRSACKAFMADGKEYTVNQVVHIVSAGLTQEARAVDAEAPEVKVNWSTAKTALEGTIGIKMVPGKKNTYVMSRKATANPTHK